MSYYKSNVSIIKNRFIYMSDISRGFSILLDCLIYIQQFIPDISLVVFRNHEFTPQIHNKIKLLHNYKAYGKESQQVIAVMNVYKLNISFILPIFMKHSVIVLLKLNYIILYVYIILLVRLLLQ